MNAPKKDKLSLGILTVATNEYLSYWKSMAQTVEKYLAGELDVTLHVFTNQVVLASAFKEQIKGVEIVVHEIPGYGWPEATLLRYRIFNDFRNELHEETLMHLDADMLFHTLPKAVSGLRDDKTGPFLVAHPGFWRAKGFKSLKFYALHPSILSRDLRMRLSMGAIGSWETRKISTAFVARRYRKNYVCGGTWFGGRSEMLNLISELADNVDIDRSRNVIAKWHDESHINWWASQHPFTLLDSSYCFEESYPQISEFPCYIQAVDKGIVPPQVDIRE
jgi:hypothetical protein